jgi:glycerol-3-phosphate acyltransferase PlsY
MLYVFWLAITYVIGSIPFGLFVAKSFCGVDPRVAGSGNIGATNISRTCGTGYGLLVLGLDILKGLVPVLLAASFGGDFFLGLVALAVILGHMYSCFLGGRGGKGVACFVGAFLAVSPGVMLFAGALTIVVIAASGFVSLGSLVLALSVTVFLLVSFQFGAVLPALAATLFIFWKHRENIIRLSKGEEKPWRKKSLQD